MKRPDPDKPLTYDEALRVARELAQNAESLIPYTHPELEKARYGGGFAFLENLGEREGYVLVTTTSYGGGLLSAPERTIDTVIADHLARAEHANRNIPDSELGAAQRLALQAYDADAPRVEDRTGRVPLDAETADYANFVLLALRRSGNRADSGRKALARNDALLQPPTPGRRYTQPCPHCDQLTFYTGRYPRAVCDDCANRTTDHAGRRVTGFNTHLSGGMIAYYTDTLAPDSSRRNEECAEVTRTGTCYLDGRPATMSEARFGGIVVQLV